MQPRRMLSMSRTGKSCPVCTSLTVRVVEAMALEGWVDHFRCSTCGHAWNLLKSGAGPVVGVMHVKPAGQNRRVG